MSGNDADLGARCDTLAGAWRWWAATLGALPADAWTRPTRLPGWDVHALVAHHAMFVRMLPALAASPVAGPAEVPSAAAMLRGFNAPGGKAHELAADVAELARSHAASRPPDAYVERFAADAPAAIDAVRAAGPVVVDYLGNGTFPVTEVVGVGILEAVVHGLDLARAAAIAPDLPDDAVTFTVGLLAALADPVTFVEAATGRTDVRVLPVLR